MINDTIDCLVSRANSDASYIVWANSCHEEYEKFPDVIKAQNSIDSSKELGQEIKDHIQRLENEVTGLKVRIMELEDWNSEKAFYD